MASKYSAQEFQTRFGPWALVAGGSDGIGAQYARELARRGLNVALVARRAEPLEVLAKELHTTFGVQTRALRADLTSLDVGREIGEASAELDIGLLVYNAGSSPGAGTFLDQSQDAALQMVGRNVRSLLLLSHHFGGRLRERGQGGMILMSSIACLAGCPTQAVYAASKAFDTILAEGLWHELAGDGVDVLSVLAGSTRTETMLDQAPAKFADAMDPALVAVGALDHLGKGPHFVPGDANRAAARGLWPLPRVALVNGMAQANAELFDGSAATVAGIEFDED